MEEAAHIDGASRWQAFWQVVAPMPRPILVSAAMLQTLFCWYEYAFALVFVTDDRLKALPVGLADMAGRLNSDWSVLFAGLTIAALPVIVVLLLGQRYFIPCLAEGVGK